jgi:predicted Zn-dependent protease
VPAADLPNTEDASEFEARASSVYKSGDVSGTIALYEARVRSHPQDLAVWRTLARRLAEAMQFPRAETAIAQALSLFGADDVLLSLLVFVKQEQGQSEQARGVAAHAAIH